MIFGTVTEYLIDNDNVDTELTIECDNGNVYKEERKMALTSKTYGKTHFTQRKGKFNPGMCGRESEDCIRLVRGEHAVNRDILIDDFEKCFEGKGTVAR